MKCKGLCIGLIAAAMVIHTVYMVHSCRIRSAYPKLQQQAEEYKVQVQELEKKNSELDSVIAASQTIITQKDQTIASLRSKVVADQQVIAGKDDRLDELVSQLENETDKDKIIFNLKEQVSIWSDKYSLAVNIINTQQEEIAAWEAKYNAQVVISDSWKQKYENEFTLRKASEGLVVGYQRQLKHDKVWSTLGKWGPPVAFGVGILMGL